MKPLCVYCGQSPGTTRDHVPPKCFFEEPCPNIRRITVPCCESCKLNGEPNDADARNLIISTVDVETHRVVQNRLSSARNRAFRDHGQLPAVLKHMLRADVHSSGGIYLGFAPAFNFDSSVIDRFLHRMVRGLLYEEKKSGFVASRIEWKKNLPPNAYDIFAHGKCRAVGDVFNYSVVFPEGRPGNPDSLWLLIFYQRLAFVVHLQSIVA